MSLVDFVNSYYNDLEKCRDFFFSIKWPDGYCCEKCGNNKYYFIKSRNLYRGSKCHHDESVLAHTCFEQCKMALNTLLLGIFLIFTSRNGISSESLAEQLKVNYKTACLKFYESDVAYIGASSSGKRGLGTEKQPCLVVLSTDAKNKYLRFIKLKEIDVDSRNNIEPFFNSFIKMDKTRELTTDGKTTYSFLSNSLKLDSHKIDYNDEDHDLYFLNICISNLESIINSTYHGISKRELPLFFSEFEYRFNHKRTKDFLSRVKHYIQKSMKMTKNMIKESLDQYYSTRFAC